MPCAGALPDFGLVTSYMKVFWLCLGEYLYEASEEYILERKIFKLTNKLLEVVLKKLWRIVDTSVFSSTLASPR
jgi:hypothetical protein